MLEVRDTSAAQGAGNGEMGAVSGRLARRAFEEATARDLRLGIVAPCRWERLRSLSGLVRDFYDLNQLVQRTPSRLGALASNELIPTQVCTSTWPRRASSVWRRMFHVKLSCYRHDMRR